jgi:hypothetical protein
MDEQLPYSVVFGMVIMRVEVGEDTSTGKDDFHMDRYTIGMMANLTFTSHAKNRMADVD